MSRSLSDNRHWNLDVFQIDQRLDRRIDFTDCVCERFSLFTRQQVSNVLCVQFQSTRGGTETLLSLVQGCDRPLLESCMGSSDGFVDLSLAGVWSCGCDGISRRRVDDRERRVLPSNELAVDQ